MALTGVIGHSESMPGNIALAGDPPSEGGGGLFERSLQSDIVFVQSVVQNFHSESVTSTLVLAQTAIANVPFHASNTLALVQTVHSNINTQSVTSTLALTQDAHSGIINQHVTSTLVLTSTAVQPIREVSAFNALVLSQTAAHAGDQSYSLSNFLNFTQTISHHFAVANRSIVSHLDFVDQESDGLQSFVNLTYELDAANALLLTQEAFRIYVASNTLALVQTVVVANAVEASNTLVDVLTQEVERQLVLGRSLESELTLGQAVAYEVERADTLCTYTPFVGTNGDGNATTPPSTTEPTIGSATLTLTFPYVAPTTTLELRNPEFNNNTTLNYSRIFGETRGGTLIVFSDPIWPKIKTLSMQINGLTEAQIDSLLDFLGDSLGQEIGLLDYENRQWRGLIITPDAEVTDNGECKKTVSLQFEGELV